MLKLRTDLIGFGPFLVVMGYLWGRTMWSTAKYCGYPFLTAIGLTSVIFALAGFIFFVVRPHLFTRLFLSLLGIILGGIGILFALIGEFRGMYWLIVTY